MLPGKDCFFELIGNPVRSYYCRFFPKQALPLHSRLHTLRYSFSLWHTLSTLWKVKTFLTKPQQEKAGFYKSENEKENHNNSWHSRFNSHFKVFSYLLSPSLINTATQTHLFALIFKTLLLSNMRKFLCNLWGYQNVIAFVPIAKPSSLYRLSRKHKTASSSDISCICPGSGQAQDWWTSWSSLAQRAYFITRNQDEQHTALNPQSCFQNGKGWDLSWTAYAQELCYWSGKITLCCVQVWGCAHTETRVDFPVLTSKKSGTVWTPCKTVSFPPSRRSRVPLLHVTPWLLYRPDDSYPFNLS